MVVRLPTYIDASLLRYYSLDEQGRETVTRILWQLSESHPQITFAPTLYPIIAIFLHKHDQDYTYQILCQLLQRNSKALREKQFKDILVPTTRLEHVRDIIVLIKLCTKFGIFAPIWMRDLVRDERRFLVNLDKDYSSRSNNRSINGRNSHNQMNNKNKKNKSNNNNINSNNYGMKNVDDHDNDTTTTTTTTSHNNNNIENTNNNNEINNSPIFDTPFFDWYKWIFVALPFTYCSRIVDCWLVEGQKFLFRITLAILYRFRQECSSPVSLSSEKMFEFCSKLELSLEPKGGIEQLIKEAKSLKRISSIKIAKASRKSQGKANLIIESIMRRDNQAIKLNYNSGQTARIIKQPRDDMLNTIIISNRIAPRSFKSSIVDDFELLDDLWQYIPERAAVKSVNVVFNSNNDGTSLQTFFSRVDPFEETIIIIRTTKNEVFGSFCSTSWSTRKQQALGAANKSYYFGNGETFLFTLQPKLSVYLWVGKTDVDNANQQLQHKMQPSSSSKGDDKQEEQQQQLNPNRTPTHQQQTVNPNATTHIASANSIITPKHRDSVTDVISSQLFMSATSQELIIGSGNGSFGLWLDAELTRGKTDHCRTFNNLPLCEDKDFTCKDVEVLAFS